MYLDRIIAVRNNKTIYRDGDRCMKMFGADYSKADVLNEALNQARMEETGLPIPKILEVTVIDGKWTIVSEYIKGKTLAQLMQENTGKKDEYLNLFADLQLTVHSQTCPLLNKLKDKMNRRISQSDFSATVRYDLHTRLESMPKHNKVCHGDFNPSNIIISENSIPYILDWSHAAQGNASADAAHTYLLFCLNGDMDSAKRYLELFCQKSNIAMQYVQKWMPIVAVSQTVKGNEKVCDFLCSWISMAESAKGEK